MSQKTLFNTKSLSSYREVQAIKRAKAVLPYKKDPPLPMFPKPRVEPEPEFNFWDEDRVLGRVKSCPMCNACHQVNLNRKMIRKRPKYWMECTNPQCQHKTPLCDTVIEAQRHWKAVAVLMR